MRQAWDVAIVGGGVIGWSAAWHLLRREPRLKVGVFDPKPDRSSALRGTGGARAQFGSRANIQLSLTSIEELKRFKAETGHDIGFRQVGYLLVTADPLKVTPMRDAADLQRSLGVPVEELDRGQISAIAPYLTTEDLLYGAISYSDGLLSAPDVVNGYRGAAEALGAEWMPLGVTSVAPLRAGLSEMTPYSTIVTAGHWSGQLGINFPVAPECHQLYTRAKSAGIPENAPMVVDVDTSLHFRRRGDGLVLGYNDPELARAACGYEDQPTFDPSAFERAAAHVCHRCPQLLEGWNEVGGWAGCYSVTPDGQAIIGHMGSLVVATGFGGHGVMHSPAAGLIVADLVLDGATSFDISDFDPTRFDGNSPSPNGEAMIF